MSNTASLPLTPADCDLRDFAFMPLDVQRLRDSELAANETPETCWAALLLWSASWHQVPAGSIPNDEKWMARASNAGRRWRIVREAVLRGWVLCSDGRLYDPEVSRRARIAWAAKLVRLRKIDRRQQITSEEWAAIRTAVFARDDYTCVYCGARGGRLEADHIIPVRSGGETNMENLATACLPCNRSKGSKSVEEWRA